MNSVLREIPSCLSLIFQKKLLVVAFVIFGMKNNDKYIQGTDNILKLANFVCSWEKSFKVSRRRLDSSLFYHFSFQKNGKDFSKFQTDFSIP